MAMFETVVKENILCHKNINDYIDPIKIMNRKSQESEDFANKM